MLYDFDLLQGDPLAVAEYLGISARTLRRYKADPDKMPEGVRKLLRMRAEGDLRALGGDGWSGFYLTRHGLFCPLWERELAPETVKGMFFVQQEAAALRAEVKRLRAEGARLAGRDARRPEPLRDLVALQVANDSQHGNDSKQDLFALVHWPNG